MKVLKVTDTKNSSPEELYYSYYVCFHLRLYRLAISHKHEM